MPKVHIKNKNEVLIETMDYPTLVNEIQTWRSEQLGDEIERPLRVDPIPSQSRAVQKIVHGVDWKNADWKVRAIDDSLYVVFFGPWPLYKITVKPFTKSRLRIPSMAYPVDDQATMIGVITVVDTTTFEYLTNTSDADPLLKTVKLDKDLTGNVNIELYHGALLLNCWTPYATRNLKDVARNASDQRLVLERLMKLYGKNFSLYSRFVQTMQQFTKQSGFLVVTDGPFSELVFSSVVENWCVLLMQHTFADLAQEFRKNPKDPRYVKQMVILDDITYRLQYPGDTITMASHETIGLIVDESPDHKNLYGMRFYVPAVTKADDDGEDFVIHGFMIADHTLALDFGRRVNRFPSLNPLHARANEYTLAWNVESFNIQLPWMSFDSAMTFAAYAFAYQRGLIREEEIHSPDAFTNAIKQGKLIKFEETYDNQNEWDTKGVWPDFKKALLEYAYPVNLLKMVLKAGIQFTIPLYSLSWLYKTFTNQNNEWKIGDIQKSHGQELRIVNCGNFPLFVLKKGRVPETASRNASQWRLLADGSEYYELEWFNFSFIPAKYQKVFRETWMINICMIKVLHDIKQSGFDMDSLPSVMYHGILKEYLRIFGADGTFVKTLGTLDASVLSVIGLTEALFTNSFTIMWNLLFSNQKARSLYSNLEPELGKATRPEQFYFEEMTNLAYWLMLTPDIVYLHPSDDQILYNVDKSTMAQTRPLVRGERVMRLPDRVVKLSDNPFALGLKLAGPDIPPVQIPIEVLRIMKGFKHVDLIPYEPPVEKELKKRRKKDKNVA